MSRAGVATGPAVLAAALVFAMPQQAQAEECLLDTNNNDVADLLDTDGGAIGTGINSLACGLNAEATGDGSTAVGTNTQAEGTNATALGIGANASGANATATGAGALAIGTNAAAIGVASLASGDNATATGAGALAVGDNSAAYGVTSAALATNSVAVGLNALVVEENPDGSLGGIAVGSSAIVGLDTAGAATVDSLGAIAIGSDIDGDNVGALALFDGATALGAEARALASGSIAIGRTALASADLTTAAGTNAAATGPAATALGSNATATGQLATAVGTGADATALLSTALGAGAVADLPGEFVMGTVDNTYTAPGITSRLSESRQFGRLELLTTDRFGHLASDGGQVFEKLADVQAGVALGLAMEAPDLAPAERFALRAGYGNFEGDSHAFGITMIGSLLEDSRRWTWDAGFGAGWSDFNNYESGATWGGRAGVQVAW